MTLLLKFKINSYYNTHDICVFLMANGINSSVHSMSGNVNINRTMPNIIKISLINLIYDKILYIIHKIVLCSSLSKQLLQKLHISFSEE